MACTGGPKAREPAPDTPAPCALAPAPAPATASHRQRSTPRSQVRGRVPTPLPTPLGGHWPARARPSILANRKPSSPREAGPGEWPGRAREEEAGPRPRWGAWPAPVLAPGLGCGVGKSLREPTAPREERRLQTRGREGGRRAAGSAERLPGRR